MWQKVSLKRGRSAQVGPLLISEMCVIFYGISIKGHILGSNVLCFIITNIHVLSSEANENA